MTTQSISSLVAELHKQSDFDYLDYLYPAEPFKAQRNGYPYVKDYYRVKATTSRLIKPKVIFEIGVRVGYSAAAFLHDNPTSTYIGLDSFLESPLAGGKKQRNYVQDMLSSSFPEATIKVISGSSQSSRVRERILHEWRDSVDLVHVDGDHSYEGCYTDLWFGYRLSRNKGYIMVDDYLNPKFKASVVTSTDEFAATLNADKSTVESWRGDALIRVKK